MADTEIATVVEDEVDWRSILTKPLRAYEFVALLIGIGINKISNEIDANGLWSPVPRYEHQDKQILFFKHYKIMHQWFPRELPCSRPDHKLGNPVHIHAWMEESLKRLYLTWDDFPKGMTAQAKLIFEDHCKYTPTYKTDFPRLADLFALQGSIMLNINVHDDQDGEANEHQEPQKIDLASLPPDSCLWMTEKQLGQERKKRLLIMCLEVYHGDRKITQKKAADAVFKEYKKRAALKKIAETDLAVKKSSSIGRMLSENQFWDKKIAICKKAKYFNDGAFNLIDSFEKSVDCFLNNKI